MVERVDEVRDIHPIFRANPFLIEEGVRFVQGERFVDNETLRRIDLHLRDKNDLPLYIEVEWSALDGAQMERYHQSLKATHGSEKFRLGWLIPEDLVESARRWLNANKLPVEVKSYSRIQLTRFLELRKAAKTALDRVYRELTEPVVPPRSLMYREEITFPNIISACYFEGEVSTQKGRRRIGLKKQTIGRHLDLTRCICESNLRNTVPELALGLLYEVLRMPYYYLTTDRSGIVDSKGVYHHIYENRTSGFYSAIAKKAIPVNNIIEEFLRTNNHQISALYSTRPTYCDLLCRVLADLPPSTYEMDLINAKKLIQHFIDVFSLTPLKPLTQTMGKGNWPDPGCAANQNQSPN